MPSGLLIDNLVASGEQQHWRASVSRLDGGLAPIERGLLQAVVYADIFDYPLTGDELHRYLVGCPAERAEVDEALARSPVLARLLRSHAGHVVLAGREGLVEVRARRSEDAARIWPVAHTWARRFAALPYVRMVAVSGSLAMDNPSGAADIDLLFVVAPDRLYLCRALMAIMRRLVGARRLVSPDMFLAETALGLEDRSFYVAHELTQVVPLYGLATYAALRAANPWTAEFLPNAAGPPRAMAPFESAGGVLKRGAEWALGGLAGTALERVERTRKIARIRDEVIAGNEARATPELCKMHQAGFSRRILSRYLERLASLDRMF